MSGFNVFRSVPKFAVSSLAAALVAAFPAAHAAGPSYGHGHVIKTGDTKVHKSGRDYTYLEADRGGKIVGWNVDVDDRPGTLVYAKRGGYISLKNADIEAENSRNDSRSSKQGPAVKASGSSFHQSSQIRLEDGSVRTHNQKSPALQASDGGAIHVDGTRLRTSGKHSDVVQAVSGGQVTLRDADILSTGREADGVYVAGRNSKVSVTGSDIETRDNGSNGVSVRDGGKANIVRSDIETEGHGSDGVNVSGRRSIASITSSEISTDGYGSDGVSVSHDGRADIARSRIRTDGQNAHGVNVSGGTATVTRSLIDTDGNNADGVNVSGDDSLAFIKSSTIKTDGHGSDGVNVSDDGKAVIVRSRIYTDGRHSDGVSVSRGGEALVHESFITTLDDDSAGVNVNRGGEALVNESLIATLGEDSVGVDVSKGGEALVNKSLITTLGKDSVGVDASEGGEALVNKSAIATLGRNSVGVDVSEGGEVLVNKSAITTLGKDSVGVDVSRGGEALVNKSLIATLGRDSVGVDVSEGGEALVNESVVATLGKRSVGVDVSKGGEVLINKSAIATLGEDSAGIDVSKGGQALVNESLIVALGEDSVGVNVGDGGLAVLIDTSVKTKEHGSHSLVASDEGSVLVGDNVRISTMGNGSTAVVVDDGALAVLADSRIRTDGRNADGVKVSDDGTAIIADSRIYTDGRNADGVRVSDDGKAFITDSRIHTDGRNADGVDVSDGGKAVIKRSVIATDGDRAQGVDVSGGGKAIVTRSLIDTDGSNADGLRVSGADSVAYVKSSRIRTEGYGSDGVDARDGGKVIITDSRIRTEGERADGVDIEAGTAEIKSSSIQTAGNASDGINVGGQGSLVLEDSKVEAAHGVGVGVSGKSQALLKLSEIQSGSTGVAVQGGSSVTVTGSAVSAANTALSIQGAGSKATLSGSELAANFAGGTALDVHSGAEAHFENTKLNAQGTGLRADGAGTKVSGDKSSITAGTAPGQNTLLVAPPTPPAAAVAVSATNGAQVNLSASNVLAHGNEGVAAKAKGGTLSIKGGTISATGAGSTAVWAESPAGQGQSKINVAGAAVSTGGNGAVAVKATGGHSAILVEKASSISTQGQGSYGLLSEQGGLITLQDSKVNVAGANTAAARVQSVVADQNAASRLVVKGSTLVAAGANATGIELENSARVTLTDSTVRATGASMVSTLSQGGQTQDIVVGSGATMVENNGTLLQVNRSGEGGSSKVLLDLQNHSVTAGNIIDGLQTALTGQGGTYVTLGALATFNGYVSGVRQITTKGGNQKLKFDAGSTMDELSIDNHASTSGGTIDNPIVVYGNVSVDNATLGGNWTIQGVLISTNGGVVSPGNSVGVISANSINWGPGTIYRAEINQAGQADLMQVTGSSAADISNASLVVSPENGVGGFRLAHDYTILTANGGVQGEFASTEWTGTKYPLIAMDTLYSQNAVAVRMDVDKQALNTMDFTPNQRSAGFGAASVVGKNASADAAFFSSNPAQAFDQLSGEVHATARSLLFSDLLSTSGLMQSQMRSNLGAVAQPGQQQASAGAAATVDRPLWVQLNAGSLHADGDGNAADAHRSSTRLMFGGDSAVGAGWRLGAAGAVSSGDFTVDGRGSDGRLSSYTMMLYGGNSWNLGSGKLNLLLGGGYTKHDVDTKRNVNVASAQTLRADYHGSTWQMFGDVGYAIPWGGTHNVEPYVNVSWYNQRMDSFNETGGDAALRSGSGSNSLSSYSLGLRSALVFPGTTNAFTLRTNLAWRHAAGDRTPSRSMSFIEGAGGAFSIAGVPIAKDSLLVGVSAEVSLDEHAAMGLSYTGEYGSGYSDSTGSLFLKLRF